MVSVVPGPVVAEGPGGQGADVAAPHGYRHGEIRPHAARADIGALPLRFLGKVVRQARQRDHVARRQRAPYHGAEAGDRRRRGLHAFPCPEVGLDQAALRCDQGERAPVGAQHFDEQAQRPLDLPVHLLDGQAREAGRQVRLQATEGGGHDL